MNFCRLVLVLLLILPLSTAAKNSTAIDAINSSADRLEKRISERDKSLPSLNVEYDFRDATEGVPPNIKCFFETKKTEKSERSVLRVCKIHIGHEVYSVIHTYYLDESGRPMKYLVVNSGISGDGGMPASREGVIYDKSGRIVWSSTGGAKSPMTFKEIIGLFSSLNNALGKF
ncbi:MAG: hypothetical protein J0L82_16865 [Deltaproteobacteria bacterium]|nr:hypothetical protein [Deltaproteobacteria bacterium]